MTPKSARIFRPTAAALMLMAALTGCRTGSSPQDERFPQLKDIPTEAIGISSPEDRAAAIRRLERLRGGEGEMPRGAGVPAVPGDKSEPKTEVPQSGLGQGGRTAKGFIASEPPAAQAVAPGRPLKRAGLSLRGSLGADGAARPVTAEGVTGALRAGGSGPATTVALAFSGDTAQLRVTDHSRILNAAASHVARGGSGALIVAGGRTGSGSSLDGFTLGLKRASSLADLLVDAGLRAEAITVSVAGDRRAADQVPAPYLRLAENGAVVILR